MGASARRLQEGKNTQANLELALSQLVDLMRARRSQSKPPPPEKVADALNYLFRTRLESPRFFSRNEIYLATESLRHLEELRDKTEAGTLILSEDNLYTALAALAAAVGRDRFRSDSQALAHMIFQELRDNDGSDELEKTGGSAPYLATYIAVLARTGGARRAQELLEESSFGQSRESMRLWASVVEGLATEGLEKEALVLAKRLQQNLGPLDPLTHEDLVNNFAAADKVKLAKAVYGMRISQGSAPTTKSMVAMIRFCIRNNESDLGEAVVVKTLATEIKGFEAENAILLWYAVKGVEVSQLHDVLGEPLRIEHINSLLEHAYSTRNQEMTRALLSHMNASGLRPDAKTHALHLDNHLSNGALQAAISSFDLLSSEDRLTDNSDVPALNKLLATLCFQEQPNYELIMRLSDRLLDRGADIDAEAIAGLCSVFLQRDELQQIVGLLRHRVDSFPEGDRARIASIFRVYITNAATDEQRAYNA
jgi:hypothetical protein